MRVAELEAALQITERGECGHEGIALALKQRTGELAEMTELRRFAEEAARELAGEVERLRASLGEACDVAVWMSGSSDFSPGGVAHAGWEKARPRLHAALAALAPQPAATGEGT